MRARQGVSTYVQTFLLVGMAIGGSGIALDAATGWAASSHGTGVTATQGSISQGTYFAFERLEVYNSGSVSFTSWTVTTSSVSSALGYCYSILNPLTSVTIASTCPTMSANPGLVTIVSPVPPGGVLLVELTIQGQAFTIGASSMIVVTTSTGSQAALSITAESA